MGFFAQVTVSVRVPPIPGAPGIELPRTGTAVALLILLACVLVAAGVLVVTTARTSRQQGDAR